MKMFTEHLALLILVLVKMNAQTHVQSTLIDTTKSAQYQNTFINLLKRTYSLLFEFEPGSYMRDDILI
jgi:hypothetical protein